MADIGVIEPQVGEISEVSPPAPQQPRSLIVSDFEEI
jgi:hypothetical protein